MDTAKCYVSPCFLVRLHDRLFMKSSVSIGKAKAKMCASVEHARQGLDRFSGAQFGDFCTSARALTEEWRRRVKGIRLNRPGQKRLSLSELIREVRK
jgi:hypothetical protein